MSARNELLEAVFGPQPYHYKQYSELSEAQKKQAKGLVHEDKLSTTAFQIQDNTGKVVGFNFN